MGVWKRVRSDEWEWGRRGVVVGERVRVREVLVPSPFQLRLPWVPASVHGQKKHATVGSQALPS